MSTRSTSTGRLALLALSAAILLGAAAALLPRAGVDAQNRNYFGQWYAKVGEYAVCPDQNEEQEAAGFHSWTSPTSITLYFRSWGISNCDADNVVERNVENVAGGYYSGQWYLELRDAPGSGGSLIDGAHINLPDGFADRRTDGTFNRRDQDGDGDWPTYQVDGSYDENGVLPVEVSFTIPDAYRGSAFLHAGIYFNEQDENYNVWEDFSFEFSPTAVTLTASDCVLQYGDATFIQDRYYARLPALPDGPVNKENSDKRLSQIPQGQRISEEQRECAQLLQAAKHPGLSWSEHSTCRMERLISLRRTGVEEREADGVHAQFQRVATWECRYVQTPAMADGSAPPKFLVPPSEPRTTISSPTTAYFWLCWRECS